MNNLSTTVKMLRKQYNLTQEELSLKSGVGLRFVRDLEQGKETLRLDKVNQLLDFFNYEMVATPKSNHPSGIKPSKKGNSVGLIYASFCKGNVRLTAFAVSKDRYSGK